MASFLLDTHVFIWADKQPAKLSDDVKSILNSADNQLFLSMASLWEMQIKLQLNKLDVSATLTQIISRIKQDNIYQILPITEQHLINLKDLPDIHRDPFDRMIISQAITENMSLLSYDKAVQQYPLTVLS